MKNAIDLAQAIEKFSCDCKRNDYKHASLKHRYNLHWSFGNGKLAKEGIVSFNTPAYKSREGFLVCPNASTCALVCYARQGRFLIPNVAKPREHNLAWLNSHTADEFISEAVEDILHLHPFWSRVRIHDSGDFFSETYFLAWQEIARQCRHMEFYGYTKMISMLNHHRHLLPENMHVVQSVGGKEDALIDTRYAHAIIFPTEEAMETAGYIDGTESDSPAYTRQTKIGLVYHGSVSLTQGNRTLLEKKALPVLQGVRV